MQAIRAGILWLPQSLLLLLLLLLEWRGAGAGNSTKTLLSRQRRYLIFQKGATILVQGNIAKAILGAMPRGLNVLTEWTWTYELPASIERLAWHEDRHRTSTTAAPALPPASWQHWQPAYVLHDPSMPLHKKIWLKKQQRQQQHVNNRINMRRPTCQRQTNAYRQHYQQPVCKASWQRRRLRRRGRFVRESSAHSIILDVLAKWAELQAYQPRYCVMRTLCESRHLLAAPGRSLFHDAVRICLRYAMPYIRAATAYTRAYAAGHGLPECAALYGPHCRHSFLAHFTQRLHG